MGLLAPSILLAIISNPPNIGATGDKTGEAVKVPTLPKTAALYAIPHSQRVWDRLFPTAHADGPVTEADSGDVQMLSKGAVNPGFWDGVMAALGRPNSSEPTLWVVGKTPDVATASKTAHALDAWLKQARPPATPNGTEPNVSELKAHIVKAEGSSEFYVTVGGVVSAGQAREIDKAVKKAAVDTLTTQSAARDKSAATLAIGGNAIHGQVLFQANP
jgi:hypothetical protein